LSREQLLLLPLWYVVFLLSVTCHEAAHAFAAYRGGDPTAYLGGQVSLNPLPHMQREPFGTILVPLLSFLMAGWMMGWASAPYDPYWEQRHPRRAAVMAAAGPLANLLLAVIAFVVLKVGLQSGVWVPAESITFDHLVAPVGEEPGVWKALGRFCSVMLSLNFVLFLFNLLPFPPMDGASVIAGTFEPARGALERLRASPGGGMIGLVLAWVIFGRIFVPLYRPVLAWLYG
jgi:Zn-dependent protease